MGTGQQVYILKDENMLVLHSAYFHSPKEAQNSFSKVCCSDKACIYLWNEKLKQIVLADYWVNENKSQRVK